MRKRVLPGVCMLLGSLIAAQAGTVYVDLSGVVNTAREDDGVADNRAGGWSDEGINDMYIYPPIPVGEVERNAHRFFLVDPARQPGGRAVLMLRGRNRGQDKPESAEVAVPAVKAAYLYVLQNSVGTVAAQPDQVPLGTWTVGYADGTETAIPIRAGVELRPWWTGQWWDNNGASAWPIFMGRNVYTMKWNKYIGVWSMQWKNPCPEKPVTRLHFKSEGLDAPVIWAATLSDENFYAEEAKFKSHFGRPDGAPDGWFAAKLSQERQGVVTAAREEGLLKGIRAIHPIRADLLQVIVDSALGDIGPGPGDDLLTPWMAAARWTVTGPDQNRPLPVQAIGRQSYEAWRGDVGTYPANSFYHHSFYLRLAQPMQSGQTYTVSIQGLGEPYQSRIALPYDDRATETPALKVNQVAYSGLARQRYAYLGWWAGDLGAVDFTGVAAYEVHTVKGQPVATGTAVLRSPKDECSGEQVWELDLAAVPPGGPYRVHVPGLGMSAPFRVGGEGMRDLYYHTARAFFHQRCGQTLAPPHTWIKRDACHRDVYESGFLVGNPDHLPGSGEAVRSFTGGYHDAGDDDCFTYHLRATAQWLSVFEQYPGRFKDGDLNLPESGNGIPDLLDEAWWALEFYLNAQQADGGVPLGRGNDQDAIRDWERKHGRRPLFGIFPPDLFSSTEFAAVAAQLARLIQPYDARRAASLTQGAARAYAWARAFKEEKPDQNRPLFEAWAAGELYVTTGEARYQTDFLALETAGAFKRAHWKMAHNVPGFYWSYANCKRPECDKTVQGSLRQDLIQRAGHGVKQTSESVYRNGHNGKTALGWGNGHGGGHYADLLLRAFWLTGEAAYLEAASVNADFQLGANPLSKTFVSGLGARPPVQPQLSPLLYAGPKKTGRTVEGISIYGLSSSVPPGYPAAVPLYRHWRDISGTAEDSSEFTITETVGGSAMLYSTLHALE